MSPFFVVPCGFLLSVIVTTAGHTFTFKNSEKHAKYKIAQLIPLKNEIFSNQLFSLGLFDHFKVAVSLIFKIEIMATKLLQQTEVF